MIDLVPLYQAKGTGPVAAGFTMFDVDDMGLLKMDFLGLRNLTVIADAVRHIKASQGVDADLSSLPLDDPDTYAMLSRGETCGVFQFESEGITKLLRAIRPARFEGHLRRPGPVPPRPDGRRRAHRLRAAQERAASRHADPS